MKQCQSHQRLIERTPVPELHSHSEIYNKNPKSKAAFYTHFNECILLFSMDIINLMRLNSEDAIRLSNRKVREMKITQKMQR